MDLSEFRDLEQRGEPLDFLFFFGHRPLPGGRIGTNCLSQWWTAPFEADGDRYLTAEHFLMAQRPACSATWPWRSTSWPRQDRKTRRPWAARCGASMSSVGSQPRYDIVVAGNTAKFTQNPAFRDFLRWTGEQILVEANPTDRVWSIGLASNDIRATKPSKWRGQNLLGFALMEVRARLRVASDG